MSNRQASLTLIRRYLDAIEAKDADAVQALLHPDARQVEYPNQLIQKRVERDLPALMAGLAKGSSVIEDERYEIVDSLVEGDRIACRVTWQARLKVPVLGRNPGDTLRADFGVFITVRDGLIVEQHNYDCYAL